MGHLRPRELRLNAGSAPRKAARAAFSSLAITVLMTASVWGSSEAGAQVAAAGGPAPPLPITALGALLGLDEASLTQTVPDLQKLPRALPGPRGSRGVWAMPERMVAGVPLETVFFFKARKLERIEQRKQFASTRCNQQFDQLTAALEVQLGGAVRSTELEPNSNRSAAWNLETYRLAAFQTRAAGTCNVMLVHEPLNLKDAADL